MNQSVRWKTMVTIFKVKVMMQAYIRLYNCFWTNHDFETILV